MLNDVQIEDGTVRIIYGENGAERRIEKINAELSLPHLVDPLTAKGDFDWEDIRVGFDLKLATPADLKAEIGKGRSAARHRGDRCRVRRQYHSRPEFSVEGDLMAKSQSVPSLIAWIRKEPRAGRGEDGELEGRIAWSKARSPSPRRVSRSPMPPARGRRW